MFFIHISSSVFYVISQNVPKNTDKQPEDSYINILQINHWPQVRHVSHLDRRTIDGHISRTITLLALAPIVQL